MKTYYQRFKSTIWFIITVLIFTLCSSYVLAATANGTITVTVANEDRNKPISNMEISLYKVADWSEAGKRLFLTSSFINSGIQPDSLCYMEYYSTLSAQLNNYVIKSDFSAEKNLLTNSAGKVVFTKLSTGVYLLRQTSETDSFTDLGCSYVSMQPTLIVLPYIESFGTEKMNVSISPKIILKYSSKMTELIVCKTWKDNNNEQKIRPSSINVGLYKNGVLTETVMLNIINNWTHTWSNLDSSYKWTVKEKPVPDGYTATVKRNGKLITITNTLSDVYTSRTVKKEWSSREDTSINTEQLIWPIIVLSGVCVVLIALGLIRTRRRNKGNI